MYIKQEAKILTADNKYRTEQRVYKIDQEGDQNNLFLQGTRDWHAKATESLQEGEILLGVSQMDLTLVLDQMLKQQQIVPMETELNTEEIINALWLQVETK